MLQVPHSSIGALVARRRPGYGLEQPFFLSQEIFDLDMEVIFGRHWIFIGVEADVPQPGDTMVVDVGRTTVLVLRDEAGTVRAVNNVCRHRGARLVHDYKASVGNLVCRYHQWTYGLDGALQYAEHMGEGFDKSCLGLKPVHLKSLEGLLFVCLSEDPPADFDTMAEAMRPYIAPHGVRDTKVAFEMDIIEPGNWKITMENNRECYHCSVNHPELTVPLFAYGFGFAPEQLDETGKLQADRYACLLDANHADWEAKGFPSRTIEHLDDVVTGYRTQRLPLDGAGESHTLSTEVACRKLLGGQTERKLGGLHFWTQPNSWHHFMSDHAVVFSVLPLDPEHSLLRTKWLVHKDAVEGVDYDIQKLTEVWVATNAQDSELVGYQHSGVSSPAYEPGPYSPYTEGLVDKFANWYLGRIAEHLER
jgi:Rieske 2Fe-2S family protein